MVGVCFNAQFDSTCYTVNRLGESAYDKQVYVPYYKTLDPRNPQVHQFLKEQFSRIASINEVDYIQLDYIRYADVILARGLWDKYGLVMDKEYPKADYCYCDSRTTAFLRETGIDIRKVEDPSTCKEWAQFRCDAVTDLVNELAEAIHAKGKKVTAEEVQSISHKKTPVYSGLFICRDWKNKANVIDPEHSGLVPSEIEEAVAASMKAGAAGVCLFTPDNMTDEHWEAFDKSIRKTCK